MAETVTNRKVSKSICEELKDYKQKHGNNWVHAVPFACGIIKRLPLVPAESNRQA